MARGATKQEKLNVFVEVTHQYCGPLNQGWLAEGEGASAMIRTMGCGAAVMTKIAGQKGGLKTQGAQIRLCLILADGTIVILSQAAQKEAQVDGRVKKDGAHIALTPTVDFPGDGWKGK